jgi:hypothetical protein
VSHAFFDVMARYMSHSVAGRNLNSLHLSNAQKAEYETTVLTSFAQAVAQHTALTCLRLLNIYCEDEVQLLRDAILVNTSLRYVDLSLTGLWTWDDAGVPSELPPEHPYCDIVLAKKPALHSLVLDNMFDVPYCRLFAHALANNYSLTRLDLQELWSPTYTNTVNAPQCFSTIAGLLQRNQSLQWSFVHAALLGVCVAFSPLHLPPYVLLEIFDWLPLMEHVSHLRKIRLIEGMQRSRKAVLAAR